MKVSVIEKPPAWNQAQTAAWALLWRDKKALLALVYLVALYAVALLAPLFIGDQISRIDFGGSLLPPSLAGGHILGTDTLGRDLFLRILFASRISLFISATVVIGSGVLGVLMGIVAGYYGGRLDEIIMRLIDLMMAFPGLLLVLVIVFIAGNGIDKMIIVLVVTGWTGYARVVRAETMRLREYAYIESARAVGSRNIRIIFRHILPNLLSVMATLSALGVVGVIMTESGLSFLGMGIQPPDISWGLLVADGRGYLTQAWWLAVFPGAAIFLTSMAYSLLADWLSVIVDPVQRARLMAATHQPSRRRKASIAPVLQKEG